jgi:hypothetical protein
MITIIPAVDDAPTPTAAPDLVQPGTRRLLIAFALLTALATHHLLVLGGQTDRYWAWTIQDRPTAAFLGAAYAAGFLLSVLALRRRSWQAVRIAVATVTVFTVLTLVATVVHLHKLHLDAPEFPARAAAWFWLLVYLVVPALGAAVLLRQEPGRPRATPVRRPVPRWLRRLLAGQGLVLGAAGVLLFAGGLAVHHHVEPVTAFWPWPLAPLGAQAIGAWLIAFGVASVLVIRDGDLARLRVPAAAYTAFGVFQLVVLLAYRTQATGSDAVLWSYGLLLASIVAAGGAGWWSARRRGIPSGSRPA